MEMLGNDALTENARLGWNDVFGTDPRQRWASKSAVSSACTIQLVIRDIDHMFNAPAVDPLSPGILEILGITGSEILLQRLETRSGSLLTTVQLIVPENKFSPGLAVRTENALRRFAATRILHQESLLRELRFHGWRLTGIATILLAFFLSLSSLFAGQWTEALRPLLRRTLEYGFEIIGWVMLWYPIEVLVFQPIAVKSRIKALRRLINLKVVVEAAGPDLWPEKESTTANGTTQAKRASRGSC